MLSPARKIGWFIFVAIAMVSATATAQSWNKKRVVLFLISEKMKVHAHPLFASSKSIIQENNAPSSFNSSLAFIPKFERPRGAVFCRMEDEIQRRAKYIKVTVGVK